jgi:hypothetical protein
MFGRKKKAAPSAPEGRIHIDRDADGIYVVTFHGTVTTAMYTRLQDFGAKEMDKVGSVKIMMVLKDFGGWKGKAHDGDFEFLLKYDALIEKLAVVGKPELKEGTLLFMGAGYRQAQVSYFTAESEAKSWLQEV